MACFALEFTVFFTVIGGAWLEDLRGKHESDRGRCACSWLRRAAMASFTALAESLGEDLAGLLTPHLPTRSGLHLSLTSKSLQALCSSQTWERHVLGRALGSTGSTLGDNAALTGLLHRAAMDQHRFERHRKLQQQERRLEMSSRKRPCPASTYTEPFGVRS